MNRPVLLLSIGLLCLVGGCPTKGSPSTEHAPTSLPTAASPAPPTPEDFEPRKADAVPALAFSLYPGGLPALQAIVGRFARHLPAMVSSRLRPLLAAPDLWAAIRLALQLAGKHGVPTRLDGWDPRRRVEVELFEPCNAGDMALAGRVLITATTARWIPGLCHRVRLPATDVKVASASVRRVLKSLGLAPVPTRDGRSGVLFRRDDSHLAAVLPEKDHVRIEICDKPFIQSRQLPDVEALWERTVLGAPGKGPLPRTPARKLARSNGHVATMHLRPWSFRDVSTQWGARKIAQALRSADPASRQALLAMGLSEVSTAWLLMSPVGAEADDLSLALDATANGLRLTAVWSLTPRGQKVYQAAAKGAGSPLVVKRRGERLLQGWAAVDTEAMLEQARLPAMFRDAKRASDVLRPIQEAGFGGLLHVMVRHQVGTAKAMLRGSRPKLLTRLPRALGFAVEEFTSPSKIALAVDVPDGQDPVKLQQELQKTPGLSGLSTQIRKHKGAGASLLIGRKTDPRRVFGTRRRKVPPGVLAELTLDGRRLTHDLSRLGARIARHLPFPGRLLDELAAIRSRVSVRGRAMVGEIFVDLRGSKPVSSATLPSYADDTWTSPGLAYATSKGGQCLDRVTKSMVMAFRSLAQAPPELKGVLVARALKATGPALDCAESDPFTRAEATRIRALVALFQADQLDSRFKRDEQLALLAGACKRGVSPACTRAREVRARPAIRLARSPVRCLPYIAGIFSHGYESRFTVAADGKVVPAGRAAGTQRLLVVDAATPARAVVQAIHAATPAEGVASWGIVFRGKRGQLNAASVFTSRALTKGLSLRLPAGPWEKVLPRILKAACGPKAGRVMLR